MCLVCAQYKKMVPFKKVLSQIMNGLNTNHFCSMGTIMKFVFNMEVLDAELEQTEQISLFPAIAADAHRIAQVPCDEFFVLFFSLRPEKKHGLSGCKKKVLPNLDCTFLFEQSYYLRLIE